MQRPILYCPAGGLFLWTDLVVVGGIYAQSF